MSVQRPITGRAIITRCRAGARLVKTHGRPVRYALQPSGIRLKPHYALRAISSGKLRAMDNGNDDVQAWTAEKQEEDESCQTIT